MKTKWQTRYWIVVIVWIGCAQAFAKPFAVGPYLGQIPPGPVAQVFAPGLICDTRPHQSESHGHFSADGNIFCYNRLGYVYITENTDQGWTKPERIESIPYYTFSCCLSPDANSIYVFMQGSSNKSKRNGYVPSKDWSLHRSLRTSQGWSLPQELGPPFTSSGQSWGFSVAENNSIYFWGSKVPYGRGCFWVAPFVDNTWPDAIKVPVDNIAGGLKGHHPGIAPDESFMVFYSKQPGAPGGTETDLYLTLRRSDGTWTEPRNMGSRINTRYHEFGARISPDKKYMFFTRSTGWNLRPVCDTGDIYWVELKEYLPESYR